MKKKQYKKPEPIYIDSNQIWPRKLAIKIMKLDSRVEMDAAVEKVPLKFRQWVKDLLNDWIKKYDGIPAAKARLGI